MIVLWFQNSFWFSIVCISPSLFSRAEKPVNQPVFLKEAKTVVSSALSSLGLHQLSVEISDQGFTMMVGKALAASTTSSVYCRSIRMVAGGFGCPGKLRHPKTFWVPLWTSSGNEEKSQCRMKVYLC